MNIFEVYELCKEEQQARIFFEERGILYKERRCKKGHIMKFYEEKKKYRCNKRQCRYECGIYTGTWLCDSRLPLGKALLFIYSWAQEYTTFKFCSKEFNMSSATIVDWKNYLREVCAASLLKNPIVIGGKGLTVEIDESCFSRRKYNIGRIYPQQWVFGGICRETKECFLYAVPDRRRETLEECIRISIRPGSIIMSDMWKSYSGIEGIIGKDYRHCTVNHSKNFVDQETGAHTQSVESMWAKAKRRNKKECGTHRSMIDSYLCEFMWRQRNSNEDFFDKILKDIVEFWPPEVPGGTH